jgi:hypothetical protein
MSRGRGGYIGFNRVPAASGVNSAASGVWTLREAEALKRAATWPASMPLPLSISGLQLWLDASDSATMFDATTGGSLVAADGAVARWEDKSGNGLHATQSDSGFRPVRKAAIQGGKDVLRFDGSDDQLSAANVFTATSDYTVFFVGVGKSINNGGRAFVSLSTTSEATNGYFHYIYRDDISNKSRVFFTTNAETANSSNDTASSISYNAFHMMSAVHSATNRQWWINGSSQGTANASSGSAAFSSAQLRVGWYYSGISPNNVYGLDGDICEIIIYNSALSDANRALVENYLIAKWGIT